MKVITAPHLLLAAFGLVTFLSMAFGTFGVLITPNQPERRLGLRGLMRVKALRKGESFATIEPLMRWVAARINPFVRGSLRAKIDRQITIAGDFLGLHSDEYVALCILGFCGGLVFGIFVTSMLHKPAIFVVMAAIFGASVPYFHISGEASKRLRRIQRGLPYAIDLVALSLTAGLDFPSAITQVIEKASDPEDPLMAELGYVLQDLNLGKTRKQALLEFSSRAPIDSVLEFVNSVVQGEERGNPLAEVLQIQAVSARQRRSTRGEEQAAKASLKMIGPCLCVFVCVILLIGGPMFLGIQGHLGMGAR